METKMQTIPVRSNTFQFLLDSDTFRAAPNLEENGRAVEREVAAGSFVLHAFKFIGMILKQPPF
jgi:hypothetical protein